MLSRAIARQATPTPSFPCSSSHCRPPHHLHPSSTAPYIHLIIDFHLPLSSRYYYAEQICNFDCLLLSHASPTPAVSGLLHKPKARQPCVCTWRPTLLCMPDDQAPASLSLAVREQESANVHLRTHAAHAVNLQPQQPRHVSWTINNESTSTVKRHQSSVMRSEA